jgi:hypothetical protein
VERSGSVSKARVDRKGVTGNIYNLVWVLVRCHRLGSGSVSKVRVNRKGWLVIYRDYNLAWVLVLVPFWHWDVQADSGSFQYSLLVPQTEH